MAAIRSSRYEKTISGFNITNTYEPEKINIEGTKTWDDANNQDGKRTDSVIVELMNGNTVVQTITLNQSNNWQHVFTNVPKYSKAKLINYTVRETRVPSSYDVEIVGNMQEGYTVFFLGSDATLYRWPLRN